MLSPDGTQCSAVHGLLRRGRLHKAKEGFGKACVPTVDTTLELANVIQCGKKSLYECDSASASQTNTFWLFTT